MQEVAANVPSLKRSSLWDSLLSWSWAMDSMGLQQVQKLGQLLQRSGRPGLCHHCMESRLSEPCFPSDFFLSAVAVSTVCHGDRSNLFYRYLAAWCPGSISTYNQIWASQYLSRLLVAYRMKSGWWCVIIYNAFICGLINDHASASIFCWEAYLRVCWWRAMYCLSSGVFQNLFLFLCHSASIFCRQGVWAARQAFSLSVTFLFNLISRCFQSFVV